MISNRSKNLTKKFVILLVSLCILGFSLLPFTTAWFSDGKEEHEFYGEALIGYFESGLGTADNPYRISTPRHFYNFAWLINLGILNKSTCFELSPNITTLDMGGALNGNQEKGGGAIPPIGTSEDPFIGTFNGNGVVIKNLWVSTDKNDWYEHPEAYNDYEVSPNVGLFGNIAYGSDISNFYLENIEVTTTVTGGYVGIIAGYVDGNISNIGINDAKLSFKSGNTCTVTSEYSLIGHKTNNVIWEDLPSNDGGTGSNAGGELMIIPHKDRSIINNLTPYDPDATEEPENPVYKEEIPNSLPGTAYYISNIEAKVLSPQKSDVFKYNKQLSFVNENFNTEGYVLHRAYESKKNPSDTTVTSPTLSSTNYEQEFVDLYNTSRWGIFCDEAPSFTMSEEFPYPQNCIWFKPVTDGDCSIAFTRQDNGNDENMSIYRIKRNGNTITEKKEIILSFPKTYNGNNNNIGNGATVYFTLTITKEEVLAGYEYVIAKTTAHNGISLGASAGFTFLKLAGTNITGGGLAIAPDNQPYRLLKKIDFVDGVLANGFESMTIHKSILAFEGTQSTAGAAYFGTEEINGINNVIYYEEDFLDITQVITAGNNPQSVEKNSKEGFTERETTTKKEEETTA